MNQMEEEITRQFMQALPMAARLHDEMDAAVTYRELHGEPPPGYMALADQAQKTLADLEAKLTKYIGERAVAGNRPSAKLTQCLGYIIATRESLDRAIELLVKGDADG